MCSQCTALLYVLSSTGAVVGVGGFSAAVCTQSQAALFNRCPTLTVVIPAVSEILTLHSKSKSKSNASSGSNHCGDQQGLVDILMSAFQRLGAVAAVHVDPYRYGGRAASASMSPLNMQIDAIVGIFELLCVLEGESGSESELVRTYCMAFVNVLKDNVSLDRVRVIAPCGQTGAFVHRFSDYQEI